MSVPLIAIPQNTFKEELSTQEKRPSILQHLLEAPVFRRYPGFEDFANACLKRDASEFGDHGEAFKKGMVLSVKKDKFSTDEFNKLLVDVCPRFASGIVAKCITPVINDPIMRMGVTVLNHEEVHLSFPSVDKPCAVFSVTFNPKKETFSLNMKSSTFFYLKPLQLLTITLSNIDQVKALCSVLAPM